MVSRRGLLTGGIVTIATSLIPRKAFSAVKDVLLETERSLFLYNVYTGEKLKADYWSNGQYISDVLTEVNHLFRDHLTEAIETIDTNLLDLLYSLKEKLKINEPFNIVSGYRSPQTNAKLRKWRRGVAKNSLHMYGKAVDIRVPGYSTKAVRLAAIELQGGGVGYYPRSGFVHLDVGEIRYW
ncbi:MAG: YcbK family protein [Nitrospirae bacterium]|nr:YcbK family protein [Nitrospirota bacterium]